MFKRTLLVRHRVDETFGRFCSHKFRFPEVPLCHFMIFMCKGQLQTLPDTARRWAKSGHGETKIQKLGDGSNKYLLSELFH